MTASDDHMQETGIWERIGALMQAGGIEPTPANYDFWYRYVTGADPDLVPVGRRG